MKVYWLAVRLLAHAREERANCLIRSNVEATDALVGLAAPKLTFLRLRSTNFAILTLDIKFYL